jgi:hypothetical protein
MPNHSGRLTRTVRLTQKPGSENDVHHEQAQQKNRPFVWAVSFRIYPDLPISSADFAFCPNPIALRANNKDTKRKEANKYE